MDSINTFLGQSFRHFIKVGAVLPSSTFLAKRMTSSIHSSIVLELGPGTGVFTEEILKKLPEDGLLISIESNEIFVNYLRNKIKDKRLRLYHGDALKMKEFLRENNLSQVDCIVSGLPLGHFSKELKDRILKEASECLSNNGEYIQFEYIMAGIRSIKSFFPFISVSLELLNFPPAFVMRCKKVKK